MNLQISVSKGTSSYVMCYHGLFCFDSFCVVVLLSTLQTKVLKINILSTLVQFGCVLVWIQRHTVMEIWILLGYCSAGSNEVQARSVQTQKIKWEKTELKVLHKS